MNDYASTILGPGCLLVATPDVKDPHFARAVILLIAYSLEDGAMGLILNSPLTVDQMDAQSPIASWMESSQSPSTIFLGGPVEPNGYICMTPDFASPSGLRSVDIELISPVHLDGPHRVFRGYSGWSVGQLEDELTFKSWYVVESRSTDLLTKSPDKLWNEVLQRQEGPLKRLGLFPSDPEVN
jgi:putative transcriptional regulator